MPAAALSMAAAPRPAPSDAGEAEESPAASPDPTDSCISSSLAGSALSSQQPAGSALLSPSLMTGLGHDVSAPVAATNRTSRHSFNDPANLSERERALISEASDRGPEAPTRSWKLPVAWSWQLVLEDLDLVHAEVEKASDMAPMTLSVLVVEDQPFQQRRSTRCSASSASGTLPSPSMSSWWTPHKLRWSCCRQDGTSTW